MKKFVAILLLYSFVFFVHGMKLAEFEDIYKPRQIVVSGNDLFVVDGESIKLFSIKDLELVKIIGSKGEGPGEFKFWPRISVFPDRIFALDRISLNKKVVFFNRKGEFVSERKLPPFTTIRRVRQNYLSRELSVSPDKKKNTTKVKVVDDDLHLMKELYTVVENTSFSGGGDKKTDFENFPKMKSAVTDGDYIYVIDTQKGFYFEIYDHKGEKVNTIFKKWEKIRFTEEHKKKLIDKMTKSKYWESMKKMYNFVYPEYFPEIRDITGDSNKIYVSTYKDQNNTSEIIVMDHKGNIKKKTFVPRAHLSCTYNNKFYYLIDNEEDEVWELHSVDL